jgi:putative transposase
VVGYALARFMDSRLTLAALNSAIESRKPQTECIHHSDRGSQYAAQAYRELLAAHGLRGSIGRRGNPYDNAKAESFMKTLKVEAVYRAEYETFTDAVADCMSSEPFGQVGNGFKRATVLEVKGTLTFPSPSTWLGG